MTATVLTFNSSNINFILNWLKKQLDKVQNSSLTVLATAVSSWMNTLPSPTKFQPSPKIAITILDSFVLTLIPPQLAPLPPPSFTATSITVILFTTIYLRLRLPASNRSRIFLPVLTVLLLKIVNPVIIIFPISRPLHWLKITERIEYKLLAHSLRQGSQPPNLQICITSFIFSYFFVRNLLLSLSVKDFWKSVRIWQS